MKTLYLMRHANAAPATPPAMSDFERTLTGQGVIAARIVGRFMKANRMQPDFIHHSAAVRTAETALIVTREIFGQKVPAGNPDKDLYNAPDDKLLAAIQAADPGHNSLLVVAHNPGVSELLSALGNVEHYCEPATLGVFRLNGDTWAAFGPGTVKLEKIFVPEG
ncbi:MAG: hypothetical protein KGL10_01370 [Alphaproteobacteria bacterium]|nr:hypothetical protein [Alphaproteobacteria bacterium]